jgi:hypothetical protein
VRQFVVFCLCFCRNSFAISKTQSKDKCVAFLFFYKKANISAWFIFFRRFWEKFRVRKGILGLYCYALHKNTVTWFIIVLRWTICAKRIFFFCVWMCYNNTLKSFIVNFFLFLEYDFFFMGLKWISCALQILGKLIQFCRIKLNW